MSYRYLPHRLLGRLFLSVVAISLVICGCTQPPTPEIAAAPTLVSTKHSLLQATSTATTVSCGVGLLDHNVRMWVQGQGAQDVCDTLVVAIRRSGEQPTTWDGQISGDASNYDAVCSDRSPSFSYEVIDTGGHTYGTSWCQWLVATYGASGSITDPDLFSIVRPAQRNQNATHDAPLTAFPATEAAQRQIYADACKQHNGYIDTTGFGACRVDYPGAPRQEIPLNTDGTWNEDVAESIREACDEIMAYATAAAQSGQAWSVPPQYHADTGVCVQGHQ